MSKREVNSIIRSIQEQTLSFDPISLGESNTVALMKRFDTKFFFNTKQIPLILATIKKDYQILEINQERVFPYITTYYDTPEMLMFNQHINGKLNRYKIRYRKYISTNERYLEVKFKSNRQKTSKKRILADENDSPLNLADIKFIETETPIHPKGLQFIIDTNFLRITLVSKKNKERATIDFNLSFSNKKKQIELDHLSILEIKKEGTHFSPLAECLRELQIRPQGISKYCLGASLLYPSIKYNRMKAKILQIQKINQ